MIRRIAVLLALACTFGAIAASSASASSEYFYYENSLGKGASVSGAPHTTLYFVAAYSHTEAYYCVRVQSVGGTEQCVAGWTSGGGSVSTSFSDGYGYAWRGELTNSSGPTSKFIAEERW
jgi:hypothetical protein